MHVLLFALQLNGPRGLYMRCSNLECGTRPARVIDVSTVSGPCCALFFQHRDFRPFPGLLLAGEALALTGPLDLGHFGATAPRWRCVQELVDWKSCVVFLKSWCHVNLFRQTVEFVC